MKIMSCLLSISLLFPTAIVYAKTIKIGSYPIPLMVENNGKSGLFVDLTKKNCRKSRHTN